MNILNYAYNKITTRYSKLVLLLSKCNSKIFFFLFKKFSKNLLHVKCRLIKLFPSKNTLFMNSYSGPQGLNSQRKEIQDVTSFTFYKTKKKTEWNAQANCVIREKNIFTLEKQSRL